MITRKPKQQLGIVLLCLIGVLCLAGCGNWNLFGPSALEQDFGNSVHNNLAQSVLNPTASLNEAPAAGLSPNAGVNEMERYNKTFKGEEKKPAEMKITY